MAEGDYEYELMRCELLGLPPPEKPDPDQLAKKRNADDEEDGENPGNAEVDEERIDNAENIELNNEQIRNVTGGLDEINSILTVTQKKLNKFKVVCGSLTNLLKLKVGVPKTDEATSSNDNSQVSLGSEKRSETESTQETEQDDDKNKPVKQVSRAGHGHQEMDVCATMGSQIDKLDSLILKAEQAELSMSKQNKQMREYVNK